MSMESAIGRSDQFAASRSPSDLCGLALPHAEGTLTPQVLLIMERTAASLEPLSPSEPPGSIPRWSRRVEAQESVPQSRHASCSSSKASPQRGAQSNTKRSNGQREQRKQPPNGGASLHRSKVERWTATQSEVSFTQSTATSSSCSSSCAASPDRRVPSKVIPTDLCSGAMASVLTTDSLDAIRRERAEQRAAKRAVSLAVALNEQLALPAPAALPEPALAATAPMLAAAAPMLAAAVTTNGAAVTTNAGPAAPMVDNQDLRQPVEAYSKHDDESAVLNDDAIQVAPAETPAHLRVGYMPSPRLELVRGLPSQFDGGGAELTLIPGWLLDPGLLVEHLEVSKQRGQEAFERGQEAFERSKQNLVEWLRTRDQWSCRNAWHAMRNAWLAPW